MRQSIPDPQPPSPNKPRYSTRPFPPYAFVPGKAPHPRRSPHGHSYSQPEPKPEPFPPEQWRLSEDYLYGVDLYNYGYWWECHEVFEGLWRTVGPQTQQGQFFQALIQLAAGNLKHSVGFDQAAHKLWHNGLARLEKMPPLYMGLNVQTLARGLQDSLSRPDKKPALILLRF